MAVGLLWYDAGKGKNWEAELRAAARRYREKFGRAPTVCYVHPQLLQGKKEVEVAGVRVVARHTVLPHHFLVAEE